MVSHDWNAWLSDGDKPIRRSQKDMALINRMYSSGITMVQKTRKGGTAENKVRFHYQSAVDLSPDTSNPKCSGGPKSSSLASSSKSARETSASVINLSVSSPSSWPARPRCQDGSRILGAHILKRSASLLQNPSRCVAAVQGFFARAEAVIFRGLS